jgi:uncharacterized protein
MPEQFFDFDKIDQYGPQNLEGTLSIDASELDRDEVESVGPVTYSAKGDTGNLKGEYQVEGEVGYQLDLRCARCIEPYPFANTIPFTVRYRPLPPASEQPVEVELADEELDTEYYSERQIPVRRIAVDQIQLSLPMKPLCEESCQGLCPQCGANLNRGKCACNENVFDDRLSALKDIRDQLAKKKDV